jgi:hypothetical protein
MKNATREAARPMAESRFPADLSLNRLRKNSSGR